MSDLIDLRAWLVERLRVVTKLANLVGAPVTTGGHETGSDND